MSRQPGACRYQPQGPAPHPSPFSSICYLVKPREGWAGWLNAAARFIFSVTFLQVQISCQQGGLHWPKMLPALPPLMLVPI